jgi:hypothetical protein
MGKPIKTDGNLYTEVPSHARCTSTTSRNYGLVSTGDGHLAIQSDFLTSPIDDFTGILESVAQNKIHVQIAPAPDLSRGPVFFSDYRINPVVCDVVTELLFSDYTKIPDVAAYIQHWRFKEARDSDLALNPISADVVKTAKGMRPGCGCWLLVTIPSREASYVGAVLLGQQERPGLFRARIYSPLPIELTPGIILRREVVVPDDPNVRTSSDLIKVVWPM